MTEIEPAASVPETPRGAFCAYHHQTPKTGDCHVCGKSICDVCTTVYNTHPHCTGCHVGRAEQHPWLAAVFSLFAPGVGQVYNGEWGKAVLFFLLAPLVLPWIWGVVDAGTVAAEIQRGERESGTVPTGPLLLAVKLVFLPLAIVYVVLLMLFFAAIVAVFANQ